MPSLDRLSLFVKVVEANSFIAVADQLNLSRAAISKQIALLEQELGVKLMERTTRRLRLTEAGELYYARCKHLFQVMEEMQAMMSTLRKEPTGTLRVICARYFGEKYVIPHLGEFLAAYPRLKVDLELAERVPNLSKEEIDLVLGMSIPGPLEAVQRTISQTRYAICASPAYFEQFGIPKKPMDLVGHRYLTHSMRQPDDVLEFAENLQIHIDPFLRLNDANALLTCALDGLGIVKLHYYMVKEALKEQKLVEVLTQYSQRIYPIYVCYIQNRYLLPKIRHFIDFMLAKVDKDLSR
ncbi:LysR family transcriptional regulator [Candidatus Protochlamydia phocaeensis]|uniref:LysR family transcriptional regulator n=1 Tax=Candidatus Protochlamydia phocaeensis TaxID=1414722 RepID=UPI00083800B6|nr:LysR family transcriptional regulator [Candidatus Protochlamydia phocaeensis]